jgi:hypothetical protein
MTTLLDVALGWAAWSLVHNLGHRWWHHDMRRGVQTFYAHGEREHHRIYDHHGAVASQAQEDPRELFISFPFVVVAPAALSLVAAFGYVADWARAVPFAAGLYASMIIDHRLHILFHRPAPLPAWLERLRAMHMIHHATHDRNFFFVTGYVWDWMLGTARHPESTDAARPSQG